MRLYCVWALRRGRALAGIHAGKDRRAYDKLIERNGGSIGGLQFQRAHTIIEALEVWAAGAAEQRPPQKGPPSFFW